MKNEEIEQCKKSIKFLLDNYCKGCSGSFGGCLDCLDEQECLEEETIWIIDELQKERLKQQEILDILKKYLSVETEKYYSKSECVLVNENIYFEEPKNETDDYKKIKEWLENDR